MKYLYVLTSNEDDLYYEQMYLSIISLRLYNPAAYIVILTDEITFNTLKGQRKELINIVEECKVIDLPPQWSQKVRSRLLKTNMRNLVDGDFLYLDCDTIVLSNLCIPSEWDFNVGAVKNLHFSDVNNSPIYPIFQHMCRLCGVDMNSPLYYNSGVLYVKDTVESKFFFSNWHNCYFQYLEHFNVEVDQLSLYKINNDFNGYIKEIPGEWNWQMGFGLNYMCHAKIMHTFSSVSNQYHNIHFLKRKEFYRDIRKQLYSKSDLIHIIQNAIYSFDESVRIVPINNSNRSFDNSVSTFCSHYQQILVYGTEDYFIRVSCYLQQISEKILGFVPSKPCDLNKSFMDKPLLSLDDIHGPKQEIGVILAIDTRQINDALSALISFGFINLCVYN